MLNIINHYGNVSQSHNERVPLTHKNGSIFRKKQRGRISDTVCQRCRDIRTFGHYKMVQLLQKMAWQVFKKNNHKIII